MTAEPPAARSVRLGVSLWAQAATWQESLQAARMVDAVGLDDLWTSDHVWGTVGAPDQPVFDAYAVLAAWAAVTKSARLGPMVTPVGFRSLGLLAKTAVTVDHISGGRLILGIGAGNSRGEHEAIGVTLARTPGARAERVHAAAAVLHDLFGGRPAAIGLDGSEAEFTLLPAPAQARIPLLIAGMSVEMLQVVARHADAWNAYAEPEMLIRKRDALHAVCRQVGRDPATIELTASCKVVIRPTVAAAQAVWIQQLRQNRIDRYDRTPWLGPAELIADRMQGLVDLGFTTIVVEQLAPYDEMTIRQLGEVVRARLSPGTS